MKKFRANSSRAPKLRARGLHAEFCADDRGGYVWLGTPTFVPGARPVPIYVGRGYGFIDPDDGSASVFVWHRDINTPDVFRTLVANQRVEFEVEDTPKARVAHNVTVVNAEAAS